MIGQYAIIGQRHVLLLPLFVERVPTALQQNALMEVTQQRNLRPMCDALMSHILLAVVSGGCQKRPPSIHQANMGHHNTPSHLFSYHSCCDVFGTESLDASYLSAVKSVSYLFYRNTATATQTAVSTPSV